MLKKNKWNAKKNKINKAVVVVITPVRVREFAVNVLSIIAKTMNYLHVIFLKLLKKPMTEV